MSRHTQIPSLFPGSCRRLLAALAVTLSALLSLAVPCAHAQHPPEAKLPDHPWHAGSVEGTYDYGWVVVGLPVDGFSCGGNVTEVPPDMLNLTLDEGESVTYCLRLTKKPVPVNENGELITGDPPRAEGWWVILKVDEFMRPVGKYMGLDWVPSVGWEFNEDNYYQWRSVRITAGENYTYSPDHSVTFSHEVWDSNSDCPFLGNDVVVRVFDDEGPNARLPALSIEDVTVEEGGTAELQVRLSKPSSTSVTVAYTTEESAAADGSATAESDYESKQGTLTFTPNQTTTEPIQVKTTHDTDQEKNETFTVRLSAPYGATLAKGTATVTINDDDDGMSTLPALSIDDAAATEGDDVVFEVRLSSASDNPVTVGYTMEDGNATAGDDYTSTSGTLTFTSGQTLQTISVSTDDDDLVEGDENFTVTVTSNDATIQDGTATGTINDNDGDMSTLPALSIDDAAATEGDDVVFEVRLSSASDNPVTVGYTMEDGNATAGDDYTSTSGTLTFTSGQTLQTISVSTDDDDLVEGSETFTVTLGNPTGATIEDGDATGTINDDDGGGGGGPPPPPPQLPTLSIDDATAEEGDRLVFIVTLSGSRTGAVTVDYATADGSAEAASDYTAASSTLTLAANESSKIILVQTTEDTVAEETETFTVTLGNPTGATIEDGDATGTINDDDGGGGGGGGPPPPPQLPTLSIDDATAEEGDRLVFIVTLSGSRTGAVTVDYATADGSAEAASDYTAASGTLTFAANESSKTIVVQTTEDTTAEETETFTVTLSNPTGATITDGTATGTITDDDEPPPPPLPTLAIEDAEAEEGDPAEFTVTLSGTRTGNVTVDYATADGTAEVGADYTGTSGTLTFTPTENSKTISVPTVEDTTDEETETFTVTLSNPSGATIQDGTATGAITDDDEPPTLSIADAEVEEGEQAEFTVTLSAASARTVTVDYATADDTATGGADYTSTFGTLEFAPGEDSKTIQVPTLEDDVDEETETFTLTLTDPDGATLEDAAATSTINDDDEPPTLSIADAEVEEGEQAEFTVTLSATSARTVTVDYATADDTATGGADYTSTSGTLEFAPGEDSKTIQVPTLENDVDEETEIFTLTLTDPDGATLEDAAATGTINDDDEPPLPNLAIGDTEAREGDMAEFLVRLRPSSDETVAVSFRTVDGTAVAGIDYTSTMGTLRFEPGETSATIAVSTLTDEMAEGPERFTLELSDPVGATVADGTGVGTITDDHMARIGTVNRIILPEVGRALAFNAVTCRFDRPLSQPMADNGTQRSAGRLSLPLSLIAGRRTSPAGQGMSPASQGMSPASQGMSPASPRLTMEQALGNSSFLMPSTTEQGGAGRYTAWGCADYRHLAGSGNGPLSWNGAAFSAQIGADMALGSNTLAGVSVSRSRSSFGYHAGAGDADEAGANELRLTGVNPYIAWSVTPDLDVWGTVGHAWGEFQIDDNLGAGSLMSAATLNSGAVGINGRLLARGGTMLRLRGEGGLAHLGVTGDGDTLGAVALDMQRLRLSTEASHEHVFSFGATLTPWGELGLRHDGGDGETGAGLEVRGGLRFRAPAQGLTMEGYGRRLVAHEGAVQESGFGAVLRLAPGTSGLGPSLSLTPAWGATASGVQQLWERGASAFSMYDTPGARMNAQFAYGLPALGGDGLLTPFGALSLGRENGRGYGLGTTLAVGRSATVSLEVDRRGRFATGAIYAVMLRGILQF